MTQLKIIFILDLRVDIRALRLAVLSELSSSSLHRTVLTSRSDFLLCPALMSRVSKTWASRHHFHCFFRSFIGLKFKEKGT